ncbi:Type 1 glutamine amidotransferase-like domain-containing protein [Acidaminobacter sp. JC074]|uniref:Type 1 glutamine amidotransferase-like domain-containing protein n=1 Tax=Acidaminobacter sp. JC074 TaxID=2530199 RepID=UPI001F10D2FF|nr:Type 1 glutamine amidotransferase-like domain-containing protein [Acidaminobacter sp. JC074]
MSDYVLLSGYKENGFYETSQEAIKKVIKETASITFIASVWQRHERNDGASKAIHGWFKKMGINFKDYRLIDDRVENDKQVEWLQSSSCIFLMGGDTLALRKQLRINKLDDLLLNHKGPIIGISAGAINMAKRSVLPLTKMRKRSYVYKGIGLVDVTITPHFDLSRSEHIEKEVLPMSYEGLIYGLEEDGTILVSGDQVEFFGTVHQIHKGQITCIHT